MFETAGGTQETPQHQLEAKSPLWLRIYGAFRSVLFTAAAVLGAVCILVFAGALLLGIRPVVVISGSMEPALSVGSVVLIKPVEFSEVKIGDIVTVERPRELGLVTHRVIGLTEVEGIPALELQGDANSSPDPQPYTPETVWRYVTHVPGLGHVTLFLQSKQGLVAAGGIVLTLFAIFLLDPERLRPKR